MTVIGYTSRQPDGGGLEGCGLIDFWSYRETSNWWDVPCAAYRTSQFVCQRKAQSTTADVTDSTSFLNTTLIYTEDVNQVCKENHFRCSSGECILEVYLCDTSRDCSDGSDEEDCNRNKGNIMHSCQPTEYECDDGSCIAAAFFCDSIMNCRDGSDEYSCDRPNCTDDEVRCQGGRCIPQTALCDLKNDCGDNSDETECTWSEGNFRCFANLLLPGNRVCDGYRDCQGKNWEDEPQTCDYLQDLLLCNKTSQFQCRNGACVPPSTICIHEMDEYNYPKGCRDASHLKDCESFQCPVGYFKCPNTYCIPERYRCNNVLDCPLGEDEINCSHYTCASGSYKCHNQQVCLHQDQICDGLLHCAEDDDELFCDAGCFDGCSCTGLSFNCTSSPWKPDYAQGLPRQLRQLVLSGAQRIDRTTRSLKFNASGDMSIKSAVYINLINYPYLLNLDLSSNGIEIILPGEFERSINLKFLILSYNQIYSIERKCFIGLSKLEYLNLVGNPLMRFGQQPFSLLYHLRTLDIQETHIENVGSDLFTGLHSLGNLYSDRFFFCCLAKFVTEVETCTPDAGQFSSCQDLMKNKFLRVSLWILGLAAVLGNGGVIFWRIYRKEIIPTNNRNPAQSILISNLAIADFLLGVYMLIIGVADISFRSVYYQYSETWQTSALCKFAGFLSVLGSEGSVMLLAVITADRFQGIVFPFSSKKLRFKSTLVVSGVVWFLAFSFSAIPLIPFDYFGVSYYGRSSVCLALPLTNDFLPGWLYSVLIFLLFNFICFLLMILCYIVIYIKASRSVAFQGSMKSKRQSKKVEEQLQVASKMVFLVATDMACWLPIIIMGFLSVIGAVEIPDVIYAWTAVFIMPVNSALNPYLYTVFVNASRRKSVNTSVKSISQGYNETEVISSIQLLESTKKEDLMKSVCSDFKRRRIILAMTTSGIEKYSLANLRKRESFILTENNRMDFTDDIKKAVMFLHEKGVCHGELSEDYVIIDEFPNGEKRAFLLLPFNLLMTSRLIGEDNPEQKPSTKEDDLEKLEELVRHFEDLQ
ncbi:putative G-protein coupled receptor [Apostichopus japonicus]|uniref:Putative G-protein coupled receptor n=1 Tax=Stichopus japonicus TaxID=307972 RepID=A0A2G8JU65_STIJA|nr:putative G-protein coupled receptor [Apostichopus japonicus]